MSNASDYAKIVAYRMYEVGYTHIGFRHGTNDRHAVIAVDPLIRKCCVVCRYNDKRAVREETIEEALELKEQENCEWAIIAAHNGFSDRVKELAKEKGVLLWKV